MNNKPGTGNQKDHDTNVKHDQKGGQQRPKEEEKDRGMDKNMGKGDANKGGQPNQPHR